MDLFNVFAAICTIFLIVFVVWLLWPEKRTKPTPTPRGKDRFMDVERPTTPAVSQPVISRPVVRHVHHHHHSRDDGTTNLVVGMAIGHMISEPERPSSSYDSGGDYGSSSSSCGGDD